MIAVATLPACPVRYQRPFPSSREVPRLGTGSTALFTLVAQVPAAILARMLGIHGAVAVQWRQASGGDWAAYAADVAGRPVRSRPAD